MRVQRDLPPHCGARMKIFPRMNEAETAGNRVLSHPYRGSIVPLLRDRYPGIFLEWKTRRYRGKVKSVERQDRKAVQRD
ncbi:hypothetical protein B4135_2323 [Caldibacillus debilis]|uniref:Uncharacterized protein n=1 Tax=Caldibacillus debilis TaxID=301148 RepID=A0A150M1S5_9BACI|nr:hypothetical protein B4135_2323 [Caldibacillus debilis]